MVKETKKVQKKSVKKSDKDDVKVKVIKEKKGILKKIGNGIKNFFNRPTPIFIALIAIILVLLLFIYRNTRSSRISVGEIYQEHIVVSNIHYFINSDMNYFHATPATFAGDKKDNKKVYAYEIGYYVVDEKNNYIPFCTRSKKLDSPVDIETIISESSSWSFGDTNTNPFFFTPEVIKNIDNLHFIFRGSTIKDTDEADVSYDYQVELKNISKNK